MIVNPTEVGSGAEIGAVCGTSVVDPLDSELAGGTVCVAGRSRRSWRLPITTSPEPPEAARCWTKSDWEGV